MKGLLRYLIRAAKQWRAEKRDFRWFQIFLQSPKRRKEVLMSATPAANFLMLAIMEVAQRDLQNAELSAETSVNDVSGQRHAFPSEMCCRWRVLLNSVLQYDSESKEFGFPYATDQESVWITVTEPEIPSIEPDEDIDAFIESLSIGSSFIFSRKQLAVTASSPS